MNDIQRNFVICVDALEWLKAAIRRLPTQFIQRNHDDNNIINLSMTYEHFVC